MEVSGIYVICPDEPRVLRKLPLRAQAIHGTVAPAPFSDGMPRHRRLEGNGYPPVTLLRIRSKPAVHLKIG